MEKFWSSVPNTLVNLKKAMGKLRKQLKTASPTMDAPTDLEAFQIAPVRLRHLGLDWIEKRHMRLDIGECLDPERIQLGILIKT